MIKRTISTISLWLGMILMLYLFGSPAGAWLLAIVASLTQLELYSLLEKNGMKPYSREGTACGFVLLIITYYQPVDSPYDMAAAFTALIIVGMTLGAMFGRQRNNLQNTLFPTLTGFIFVPFMFHFFQRILGSYSHTDTDATGIFLCIWIIAVAKFADVGGLLVGRKFGRVKLAPTISPAKTWEGVIGGLVTSLLISHFLLISFRDYFPKHLGIWEAGLIAIPVAAAGIASDLFESVLKRQAKVKDSGKIIPGIGGIYDLTDSLLFSAPVAYFLLQLA